jgi:hypothetical protein
MTRTSSYIIQRCGDSAGPRWPNDPEGGGALESYFAGTRDRDAAEAACTDTYSENDLQR